MISFDKHPAKVKAVTLHAERHGEELVQAVTIKVELTCSNDVLSEFDPSLKGSLFKKAEDAARGDLNIVRFPLLGPLNWNYKGIGYKALFQQSDDLFGGEPVRLADCRVDAFVIEPRDNGIVGVTFKVGARYVPSQLGGIGMLLQREVVVTLEEPTADEQKAA